MNNLTYFHSFFNVYYHQQLFFVLVTEREVYSLNILKFKTLLRI